MNFRVKWENLDQDSKEKDRSRAKSSTVTLGTSGDKRIESPSKGIKVSKSASDFDLWHKVTNGVLPPQGFAFMHMRTTSDTLKNINESNGKFNRLVSEASAVLRGVNDKSVRVIYPRIPMTEAYNVRLTEKKVTAFFDFLNAASGNDANILPLPPTQLLIDSIPDVRKGIEEAYSTTGKTGKMNHKPLMGYIPAFENPNHAEKLVDMYLGLSQEVNTFVIDFSNGKRDRTTNVIIRRLDKAQKDEGLGDYYIHAVDVPKDRNSRDIATPFYDLPLVASGIDSFHNLLFGGGSSKGPGAGETVLAINKKKKYALQSQYGSYTYKGLVESHLLEEECNCPVCKGSKLEDLFKTGSHSRFLDMLYVHRIHLAMQEAEEQKRVMNDRRSVLDYLRQKPMAKVQVNDIMTAIRTLY